MVNKDDLKKGDLVRGIPHAAKGNTKEHNLEVLDIYEVGGQKKFLCFSLTDNIGYPGFLDCGREVVFSEEDLTTLEKLD